MNIIEYKKRNWERLEMHRMKSREQIDNLTFLLSTGSIVLSINLFWGYAAILLNKYILYISWIALILSMLFVFISFWLSEKLAKELRDKMSKITKEEELLKFIKEVNSNKNKIKFFIKLIKYITALFLIIGISLLTIFSIINFN